MKLSFQGLFHNPHYALIQIKLNAIFFVTEIQLCDKTVYEGEDAEFICEVYQESHVVSWFVDDVEATGDRYDVSAYGSARKLVIKHTTFTDNGTKVTVRVNDQEKSVQLTVKGQLFIR